MAKLNLKQIIDRLNMEFTGDTRKLVFWYDDNGEFAEDMKDIELENARVYYLEQDNQFYTKYFLERVDTTTNYLIYAPFPKPDVRENHLEDTLLYSRRFFADRASLLLLDLGIEEKYKPVIEKHIKFFKHKDRTQRFYELEIENFNQENILVGLLSAVCRTRTCSFEEVVRVMLTDGDLADNKFLEEMGKYDLLEDFWKLCEQYFGYIDVKPTLEKLLVTMFVTYTGRYLHGELPKTWKSFQSYKGGTIIAFLDSMMNNVLYRDAYDRLSLHVETGLNAETVLQSYAPEELLDCDAFLCVDQILVKWLTERLLSGDIGAKLDQLSIPDICEKRMKMHFGRRTENEYRVIRSAYVLATAANYQCPDDFEKIIGQYQEKDWMIDQEYRRFYTAFDSMENEDGFETLKNMVENIYTNRVLAVQLPKWNMAIHEEDAFLTLPLQRNFYNRYIKNSKERTVVIISDAMRYEVGRQLFLQMQDDPKCIAKMETMLGILPSYTRLGMAALLPHSTLSMKDDYTVLVDERSCDNLVDRQTILQMYQPDALCLQFDDIKNRKIAELREIFTGRQLLYVYHNQIDARGDKANTEDEVFVACEEAVREIMEFIHRISTSANTYHFIITSDHGFLYKRDKITESEKIGGVSGKNAFINRRFIVADSAVVGDGIDCLSLGKILGNEDAKVVSFPVSSHVFKVSGGGQNYVHVGSSPQEMLIPVLDVKMERGHMETRPVQIALVSMVQKITNLITTMDFIQSDPVSDIMKEATYRIYFLSEENEKISNENILVADSRESDPLKRISRLRFTFKNKKYDKEKKYFLVVYDETTGLEVFRHPVTMDLAFADDYGFGF